MFALTWTTALLATTAVGCGLFCAFWIYVWVTYFPIIVRLMDSVPLLVPAPAAPLDGGEECEFPTADGLKLRGSYLPHGAERRRGVVLFCHELKGDRWNAVPYVADLRNAGFDVFTFDFRNHGTSEAQPRLAPRPWITTYDTTDVRAAVDYLMQRPDADSRGVGVLGISRGGGAALCASAGDDRVRCVFTDGAYPSRTTHMLYLKRYIDIYIPPPWTIVTRNLPDRVYQIFLAAARWWFGRLNGFRFVDVEGAADRVRQPVLMVHGEADPMIPVEAARSLQQRLAGPNKLWVVADARHNGAFATDPEAYRWRLLRFFRLHLAEPESGPRRRTAEPAAAGPS